MRGRAAEAARASVVASLGGAPPGGVGSGRAAARMGGGAGAGQRLRTSPPGPPRPAPPGRSPAGSLIVPASRPPSQPASLWRGPHCPRRKSAAALRPAPPVALAGYVLSLRAAGLAGYRRAAPRLPAAAQSGRLSAFRQLPDDRAGRRRQQGERSLR